MIDFIGEKKKINNKSRVVLIREKNKVANGP